MKQERKSIQNWLSFSTYVSKYRYCSYWHQLDEAYRSDAKSILEIGTGSNVVASYLRADGVGIVTLDIEKELRPDVVGSVLQLPFDDNAFDTVMCCQVLEHLPYDQFAQCLTEIRRVCSGRLILSLPDKTPGISILLRVPNFLFWHGGIFLPWAVREPIRKVDEHFWEIGRRGYPARRISKDICDAGFDVERTYRVPEYPYHHFFIADSKN